MAGTCGRDGPSLSSIGLLTPEALDRRTRASRIFKSIIDGITADLGGAEQLSTVEQALIGAFAGAALHLQNLNARLMLGEQIDLAEHAHAVSSLVRVASRLGTGRRAKDEVPTVEQYLNPNAQHEAS